MVDDERARQIALASRIRSLAQAQSIDLRSCGFKPALADDNHEVLDRFEDLGISYASSRSGSDTSPLHTSPTSGTRRSSSARASLRGMPIAEDVGQSQRRTSRSQSRSGSSSRKHSSSSQKNTSRSSSEQRGDANDDLDRRPKRLNPPRAHTTLGRCNSAACPVKIAVRSKSIATPDECSSGRSDSLEPLEEALVSCRDPAEYDVMRSQLLKHFLTEDELRKRHDALKPNYPNISYRPQVCKREKKQQAHTHREPLRKLTDAEVIRMVPTPRGKECVRELIRRRECRKWRESHLAHDINWRPERIRPVDLDDLYLSPHDPIPEEFQEEARRRVEEIQRAMRDTTLDDSPSKGKKSSSRSSRKGRLFTHSDDQSSRKMEKNANGVEPSSL